MPRPTPLSSAQRLSSVRAEAPNQGYGPPRTSPTPPPPPLPVLTVHCNVGVEKHCQLAQAIKSETPHHPQGRLSQGGLLPPSSTNQPFLEDWPSPKPVASVVPLQNSPLSGNSQNHAVSFEVSLLSISQTHQEKDPNLRSGSRICRPAPAAWKVGQRVGGNPRGFFRV